MNPTSPDATARGRIQPDRISLLVLLAAIGWSVLLRYPLVLNAPVHLDSDLAVDGLTLRDALNGQWRWHYPGTPYTGTGAVLLSWVPARIWGATPRTLVSGGTVAHILLLIGVFALAWRAFGKVAAVGSLLPLTFASTGVLWLAGRITGGHLLTVAWSAWAWLLFVEWIRSPGRSLWLAALGFWCGFGLYLDSMFVTTLAGLVVAGLIALASDVRTHGPSWTWPLWTSLPVRALILGLAFLAGAAPRAVGRWMEPYDAYNEQFTLSLDRESLTAHARILLLDCLPRLIAGHRLPNLQADPDPALLGTGGPIQQRTGTRRGDSGWWVWPFVVLAMGAFVVALGVLAAAAIRAEVAGRALAGGLLITTAAVALGFVVNRNIFNSDNYRYLVLLLIPWSLGCGVLLRGCLAAGAGGRFGFLTGSIVLAALYTGDAATWYRHLGWVDDSLRPVSVPVDDPALGWLNAHPEVRSIFGSYWDVYRLSFLTGGTLRGVPFPIFPNRFPEWSAGMTVGRPETLLVRRTPESQRFLAAALREGGTVLLRENGVTFLRWPWPRHP